MVRVVCAPLGEEMETSKIAWTRSTFNPWMGCEKVHAGCTACYAEQLVDKRYKRAAWGGAAAGGTRSLTSEEYWSGPLKWNAEAAKTGEPWLVFCASLADVMEDWRGPMLGGLERGVETMADARRNLFELVSATPYLTWQILTKRPENIPQMLPDRCTCGQVVFEDDQVGFGRCPVCGHELDEEDKYWPNVWLGTSPANQETAASVWELGKSRAYSPVLWLSVEPMLGEIDLANIDVDGMLSVIGASRLRYDCLRGAVRGRGLSGLGSSVSEPAPKIDWIVIGGESQQGRRDVRPARPFDFAWARKVFAAADAAKTPVFFKQGGSCAMLDGSPAGLTGRGEDPGEWPEWARRRELPACLRA